MKVFGDRFHDRPFGSIFRQMEDEMAEMERQADRLLRDAMSSGKSGRIGPFVWGYTLESGPEGQPRIQRFGNLGQTDQALEEGWREPFVTSVVDEDEGVLRVTAELPGVPKDDIELVVRGDEIHLEARSDDRKYKKRLRSDEDLDPDSAKARYNNGILEVRVDLAETQPDGRKVDVE